MTLPTTAEPLSALSNLALGGVVVPMVTPVGAMGDPDLKAAATLAEYLVRIGADGIFVAGTTGRFSDFTPAEMAAVSRAVVDAVGDDATVYGGICDSGARRMLANSHALLHAGVRVAVATGPFYLPRAISEIEDEMHAIADRSPLPVIFYNIPEVLGYGLRPEWVHAIARHPNVYGYKDSSNDFGHHQAVLNGIDGNSFTVLIGKERLLMEALRIGARGIVVSLLQADPGPFVRLVRYASAQDWAAAAEEQARVIQVVDEFLLHIEEGKVFSSLMSFLEMKLRGQRLDLRLRRT